jgi:hypothetical protein
MQDYLGLVNDPSYSLINCFQDRIWTSIGSSVSPRCLSGFASFQLGSLAKFLVWGRILLLCLRASPPMKFR